MAQKAETLLWNRLKAKIPKHWNTTRIENRYGGGIPDVHVCAESVPFWVELKVTKNNRINISSHQVAWNFAYYKSGGVSFFLVHPLSSPNLYLFGGDQGRGLVMHGLSGVGSGSGVPCLWSGSDWSGLLDRMLDISRGRVGIMNHGSGSGLSRVGSGDSGSGTGDDGGSVTWPGPGV